MICYSTTKTRYPTSHDYLLSSLITCDYYIIIIIIIIIILLLPTLSESLKLNNQVIYPMRLALLVQGHHKFI
jgi:hypothetical protein